MDLRDTICEECGAKCIKGQTHLEHNAGWKKKLLMWDYGELAMNGWPGWETFDRRDGRPPAPAFVRLAIRNKKDRDSHAIGAEWDDICEGRFYWSEWQDDGSVFVRDGDVYYAGFSFQKKSDAAQFQRRYGGVSE